MMTFEQVRKHHLFRYGVPFVGFMVLGSVGLSKVVDVRVRRSDRGKEVRPQKTQKYNANKKAFSLEEEVEVSRALLSLAKQRVTALSRLAEDQQKGRHQSVDGQCVCVLLLLSSSFVKQTVPISRPKDAK